MDTSHNVDKSERRQQKWRHAKTATTVVKTATVHKSKRRQLLVKTATVIGQNGKDLWSKGPFKCYVTQMGVGGV